MVPPWPGSEAGRAAAVALFAGVLFAVALLVANGVPVVGPRSLVTPAAQRALPRVLAGVTAADVSDLGGLVASSRRLPVMPATRLYFDVRLPPGGYAAAVRALHPVSYLMGELLDSSDETSSRPRRTDGG